MDAGDSGHVCHEKGVKKYEVQSVNGHKSCLGQQNVVGVITHVGPVRSVA